MTNSFNIPIFLSSDNNYAPFVATTIASICDNTKSFIDFYVLDGGISPENQAKIESLKNQFQNFSIEFIKIDTKKNFKDFLTNGYITHATYFRFLIPDMFLNLDKVLYLDIDIIALKDISKLFNETFENHILGAIVDTGDKHYIKKLKENMEIDLLSDYFNAGVLLIDCKKWRENNVTKALFEIEKKYRDRLICNDQDILNKYFENNYKILDEKYNSKKILDDTVIRHFYSLIKPWHIHPTLCDKNYPDAVSFWKYAKMTDFYDELIQNCKYTNKIQLQVAKARENVPVVKFASFVPKVSIIIPVYNNEKYLRKCLNSIIYQTLDGIEIICINDSSSDNSLEILNEYAKFDNRIKIIDFSENKGVSIARNEGIKAAIGTYIGFVDSDDYIDLNFYETLFNKAVESSSEIVKGNLKYLENDTELNDFKNLNSKIKENKYNFNCNFSTAIYKTDLIKLHNIHFLEDINCCEDRYFQILATLAANNIEVIDDVFYYYIQRKNSLTTNQDSIFKQNKNRIIMLTVLLRKINNFNLTKENYTLLFNELFVQIIESLKLRIDDTKKLYGNIKQMLDLANLDKLPGCIDIVKNSDEDMLYHNLMKYEFKTLINIISKQKIERI